jgi:hypothetical protein
MGMNVSYVGGRYTLTLEGSTAGYIVSVDGGTMTAEVMTEASSFSNHPKKHIGLPKVKDFTVEVGGSMGWALCEWVNMTMVAQTPSYKSGQIDFLDYNMKSVAIKEFHDALLTKFTSAKMSADSKEPHKFTVGFQPRTVDEKGGSGKVEKLNQSVLQKKFASYQFKFEMDGLDCSKIYSVDGIEFTQSVADDAVQDERIYHKSPGAAKFGDLTVQFSASSADTWKAWHEDFVKRGNNSDDKEKTGRLAYLSPNGQEELFAITFEHCGIFDLSRDKSDFSKGDAIARYTAKLYAESYKLEKQKMEA